MMKREIKTLIGKTFSNSIFNYPIVINSYGRSGSTVLTDSIVKSAISAKNKQIRRTAYRTISQTAWNLEKQKLKDGIIYKTHDYPPVVDFEYDVRMLYTYADPIDVILSLLRLYNDRGEEWMREHYDHLKIPFRDFEDIVVEDQLRLEKHLNSWLNETRFPVAFIKYESMWDHQVDISNFLGFEINFPPFRERKARKNAETEIISKLEMTYASLKNKIKNLDDFFTVN